MMMKLMMYGSIAGASAWNAVGGRQISDEAALRFPNVLFGALTVIPLFLLTAAFFDRWTMSFTTMGYVKRFGSSAIQRPKGR